MDAKITIVVSILLWLLSSFQLAARAEMDIGEAHEKMQQVMRDCETLSQNGDRNKDAGGDEGQRTVA